MSILTAVTAILAASFLVTGLGLLNWLARSESRDEE